MGFQKDVSTTFGSQVAVLFLVMIQSVIVARYLLPEGRGQYATLMLIPDFIVLLAPLGLQWSMTYHLRLKDHSHEILLQTGATIALLLAAVAFVVSIGVELAFRKVLLTGLPLAFLIVAAGAVPARVLQACWIGVFRGTDRIRFANVTNLTRRAMLFLGVIVALVGLSGGVGSLVTAIISADLLLAFLVGAVIFKGVPLLPRLELRITSSLLSYGIRLYAFSILMFLNYRLDMGILRYFADYHEVGLYVTAVTLAEVLWTLPNSVVFVLFPSAVGVDDDTRNAMTSRVSRTTLCLMVSVAVVVALIAYPVIWVLYGGAFLPAASMLIALLPGIVAMSVQQILGADLSARGYPGKVTIAAGVGVLVNLLLNLWWIPRLGAVGAALASSASYTVIAWIVLQEFRGLSGLHRAEALLIQRDDIQEIVKRVKRLLGKDTAGRS